MVDGLVSTVKCTLGDLDNEGGVREGKCLEVGGVLKVVLERYLITNNIKLTGVGTSAPVTRSTGASR